MKVFFDTSVLVSASSKHHPHHQPSIIALSKTDRRIGCCAAHSLAELYAVLTRLPGSARMNSDQALSFLDSVEERLEVIHLTAREYRMTIDAAARGGVIGGRVYDLLLAQCALKATATRILTWNISHFLSLGPEIAARVQTP